MKFYASFGQDHTHRINGQTFDCDSLMEVEAKDEIAARMRISELTGGKWCSTYSEGDMKEALHFYPRGVINAGSPVR